MTVVPWELIPPWQRMVLRASKEYSEMRELGPECCGKNPNGQFSKRIKRIRICYQILEDLLTCAWYEKGFLLDSDAPKDLKIVALFPYAFFEDRHMPDVFEVLAVSSEFEPVEDEIPLLELKFTKEMILERKDGSEDLHSSDG